MRRPIGVASDTRGEHMFRRIGQLIAIVLASMLVLTSCNGDSGGGDSASNGNGTSHSNTSGHAKPKTSGIPGQPHGLPAPRPITRDKSNSCAGQGFLANVTSDVRPPYQPDTRGTRVQVNGGVVNASALIVTIFGSSLMLQVTTKGSFVCDIYVKSDGTWKRTFSTAPSQMVMLNGVQEVYIMAYDPALGDLRDYGYHDE